MIDLKANEDIIKDVAYIIDMDVARSFFDDKNYVYFIANN